MLRMTDTSSNTSLTSSVKYIFLSVRCRPWDAANPRHRRVCIQSGVALRPPRQADWSSKLTTPITNPRILTQNIGSEQQCHAIDWSIRRRNDRERTCRRWGKMTYAHVIRTRLRVKMPMKPNWDENLLDFIHLNIWFQYFCLLPPTLHWLERCPATTKVLSQDPFSSAGFDIQWKGIQIF